MLDRDSALTWIGRWDRQQQIELPDREERFTALIDAVQAGAGRPDPLVLDIGCGPGSLGVRLLDRIPEATVVGIDADPVTLALGAAAYPSLRFSDLDLRQPGWSAALDLDRPPDAAVSTTALHWLTEPVLRAVYAELATVLRPGGVFLDGDHLRDDGPELARLGQALTDAENRRRFPDGHDESWKGWWEAVAADPDLSEAAERRARLHVEANHHGSETSYLTTHVDALRAAGFAEVGTLWQRGGNRLLCAVKRG
jgi:SAM-dependent methyltransferase